MRKKTGYEGRREQLIGTITDAIHDCSVRRIYSKEFIESIPPLLKELRETEQKLGTKKPEWKKLQTKFELLLERISLSKRP